MIPNVWGPSYYESPLRNWAYDTLFNTHRPPGTPSGILMNKGQWSEAEGTHVERRSNDRGFTLAEVLIAIAILGIALVALMAALPSGALTVSVGGGQTKATEFARAADGRAHIHVGSSSPRW